MKYLLLIALIFVTQGVNGFLGLFPCNHLIDAKNTRKAPVRLFVEKSGPRRKGAMSRRKGKESIVDRQSGFQRKELVKRDGDDIYSLPGLYDLAFGYRNFEFETSFLLKAHRTYSSNKEGARSIIELAAGPARHSMTALKMRSSTVKTALAVDCSEEMLKYNKDMLNHELGDELSKSFKYLNEDMRNLDLGGETFDSGRL